MTSATAATHIEVDGRRLEVLTIDPRQASSTTLVMLHEGLGSVALWKDVPAELARRSGAKVVAYSRYGHGSSDVLREPRDARYMHHEAEVVLPALLARLGIERPFLFGHSDGASIAIIYAGAYPRDVAGLVLLAPHVFVEELTVRSIAAAAETYETSGVAAKLARYHADARRTFWGWNDIWLAPAFRAWNIEEYLGRIACPTLVVQGRDDEYGTEAQVRAIAQRVPDVTTCMLERCGHSPHRDRADLTIAATTDFVARVAAGVSA